MEKIIKIIGTVVVLLFCAFFVFRCCMVADRSVFSSPAATDKLKAAYSDGESVIYKHVQTTEIAEDGYFSAYAMFYNPESGEVQIAVRWNDSIYSYTGTENGSEFSLKIVNDTTGEEYECTLFESSKKSIYNYRHYIADGVSISSGDQVSAVLQITDEYSSQMIVKYDGQEFTEYKLPAKLKKALSE